MSGGAAPTAEPFWMDDPDPWSAVTDVGAGRSDIPLTLWLRLGLLLLVPFFLALTQPVMWIFVAFEAAIVVISVRARRARRAASAKAVRIQAAAKERAGASHIGSAIHTAGHPLLERDQRVVLALIGRHLSIYGYGSPQPIHTIPVVDLNSVQTVVYDDDFVPHLGVIEKSAQALQLAFTWKTSTCTCQFRWMLNPRPIDWYHALESARLNAAGTGDG